MFNLTKLEDGKLRITLDFFTELEMEELIKELQELKTEKDDISILLDWTESYRANGGYHPFDAGEGNPYVGLTEAPMIAESMDYDDDGNAMIEGDFWYFNDYMIRSFIDDIIENGYVDFTKA